MELIINHDWQNILKTYFLVKYYQYLPTQDMAAEIIWFFSTFLFFILIEQIHREQVESQYWWMIFSGFYLNAR